MNELVEKFLLHWTEDKFCSSSDDRILRQTERLCLTDAIYKFLTLEEAQVLLNAIRKKMPKYWIDLTYGYKHFAQKLRELQ